MHSSLKGTLMKNANFNIHEKKNANFNGNP